MLKTYVIKTKLFFKKKGQLFCQIELDILSVFVKWFQNRQIH